MSSLLSQIDQLVARARLVRLLEARASTLWTEEQKVRLAAVNRRTLPALGRALQGQPQTERVHELGRLRGRADIIDAGIELQRSEPFRTSHMLRCWLDAEITSLEAETQGFQGPRLESLARRLWAADNIEQGDRLRCVHGRQRCAGCGGRDFCVHLWSVCRCAVSGEPVTTRWEDIS